MESCTLFEWPTSWKVVFHSPLTDAKDHGVQSSLPLDEEQLEAQGLAQGQQPGWDLDLEIAAS